MTHKVVKVRLRHNTELYEWAASASNTARYVYNNAVSTYLFSGEMAERVVISYKPKKKSKMLHVYAFKGSSKSDRFTLNKELTKLRAEYEWLRKLPVAYGRAAITDAVTACGRVIDDNSDYTSYREDKNRIILGSVSPPIWRNSHLLYLPGFGEVETKCIVDESWDMCSFRLVDVTHHTTRRTQPKDHVFELHISIQYNTHHPNRQRPAI